MSISSTASKLAQLSGLPGAKRAVERIAVGNTGVHAVLFYGAQGSGKGTLAAILAQAWLCKNLQPDGACGQCQACVAFDHGRNADVVKIEPFGPSSLIRVNTIVGGGSPPSETVPVLEFMRTPPLAAQHKVVIIEEADRMNNDASNALLKSLEEPLPYGKFILTTRSVGLIPPTILSRCLAVACELPSGLVAGMDPFDWTLGEGAPGRAAQIAANGNIFREIDNLAKSLPRRGPEEALVAVEKLRSLAEQLEKRLNSGMRAAYAETVAAFALSLSHLDPSRPEWVRSAIEAHRRIIGNGAAGTVLDAMMTEMLTFAR